MPTGSEFTGKKAQAGATAATDPHPRHCSVTCGWSSPALPASGNRRKILHHGARSGIALMLSALRLLACLLVTLVATGTGFAQDASFAHDGVQADAKRYES